MRAIHPRRAPHVELFGAPLYALTEGRYEVSTMTIDSSRSAGAPGSIRAYQWDHSALRAPSNHEMTLFIWAADDQTSDPPDFGLDVLEDVLHPWLNGRHFAVENDSSGAELMSQ